MAVSAEAAQHKVVVENGDPGCPFQRGKILVPDDARHRHERVAAGAIEVVVVGADQFEAGPSVLDLHLAGDAAGRELLGGAKHGGKVGHPAAPGEGALGPVGGRLRSRVAVVAAAFGALLGRLGGV